jgi:hypothetical protein
MNPFRKLKENIRFARKALVLSWILLASYSGSATFAPIHENHHLSQKVAAGQSAHASYESPDCPLCDSIQASDHTGFIPSVPTSGLLRETARALPDSAVNPSRHSSAQPRAPPSLLS